MAYCIWQKAFQFLNKMCWSCMYWVPDSKLHLVLCMGSCVSRLFFKINSTLIGPRYLIFNWDLSINARCCKKICTIDQSFLQSIKFTSVHLERQSRSKSFSALNNCLCSSQNRINFFSNQQGAWLGFGGYSKPLHVVWRIFSMYSAALSNTINCVINHLKSLFFLLMLWNWTNWGIDFTRFQCIQKPRPVVS